MQSNNAPEKDTFDNSDSDIEKNHPALSTKMTIMKFQMWKLALFWQEKLYY